MYICIYAYSLAILFCILNLLFESVSSHVLWNKRHKKLASHYSYLLSLFDLFTSKINMCLRSFELEKYVWWKSIRRTSNIFIYVFFFFLHSRFIYVDNSFILLFNFRYLIQYVLLLSTIGKMIYS